MSHNPHEEARFAEQFKDYNQTSSQLQMLDKLFDSADFKSLENEDTKISLLSLYLKNLKFKMYIDAEVFSRKEVSKKNFQSFEKRFIQLNKLKKKPTLFTPEEYRTLIEKEYQQYFEEITAKFELDHRPTKKANKLSYLKDANDTEYTNLLKDKLSLFDNDIRAPSARIFNPLINTVMTQFMMVPNNLHELSNFISFLSPYLSYGVGFTIGFSELLKSGMHTFDDHQFFKDKKIDKWDKFKVQAGLRSDSIVGVLGAIVIMLSNTYLNNLHGEVQSDWGAGLMTGFLILDFIYNEHKIANEKLKLEALKTEISALIEDENERENILFLLDTQQKNTNRLNWGMRTYLFLWYTSIGINMFSKAADVLLASSIASLIIQILFSFKDTYLKLTTITDDKEWYRELEKSGLRIFVQILIPSLFICYGLFLAPTLPVTLPAFFISAALITVSSLCVQLVNRWNEYSDAKWALEDYYKEKIDKHLDYIQEPEEKKLKDNLKIASQNFYYQSGYTLSGVILVGAIAASIVTAGAAAPIILASMFLVILIALLRDDCKRNSNLKEVPDENDEKRLLPNH